MLIARAEVAGAPADVRIADGRIAEIAPRLAERRGEERIDAAGGALLPGLHDHHIHLFALAAAEASVGCGPPAVCDRADLARALAGAAPDVDGWLRGVAYHESVAGPLDRAALDALARDRPLRIQHRSGALWMLNSAAAARLGLDAGADAPGVERDAGGRATGRLFGLDGWLRDRLGPGAPPPLDRVGRRLSALGVTGVTDAGADNDAASLAGLEQAVESGALPQRLVVMGRPGLPRPRQPRVRLGAVKCMLAERALPPFEDLVAAIEAAHAEGRAFAVHCVTRAELVLSAAAFGAAGARPGDRIEHAAVAPPDVLKLVAELPLAVVTQPHFVAERGDAYAEDVDPLDLPWLYRLRGFLGAGVPLGGGSDAPFGRPDPWRAMRAAVERRTPSGLVLGADERLTPEEALSLFTAAPGAPGGPSRRVAVGADADLCLLDRPWSAAREALDEVRVAATWCQGRRT